MIRLIIILLLSAGLVPALSAAGEPSVDELKKELTRTKAELAVLKAEADLAKKRKELQDLVDGRDPEEPVSGEPAACGTQAAPKQTKPVPLMKKLKAATDGPNVFFHTGVRVLTPYKLDYGTHKLSSDSTTTGGFLEIVASNIWTWQPGYIQQSWEGHNRAYQAKHGVGLEEYDWQPLFTKNLDEGWDYHARLSFDFGADKEASAATITGSGDVGAEVAVTKHLARGWTPGGAWSVGPGISIGMVTDRQARQVHPSLFAGVNTSASFLIGEKEDRFALLRLGFGWARVDGIEYDDPMQDTIRFDGNVPLYNAAWRPAAEAELWWPMGESGQLTAGARIYGHPRHSASRLDQWTLYLGARLDIPSALGALNPAKKAKPGKAGEAE